MSYNLFYSDFRGSIFFMIPATICFVLACLEIKYRTSDKAWKSLLTICFGITFFILITFFWFIPSVRDYFGIKHNKFLVVEGNVIEKTETTKYHNYYVTIDKLEIQVNNEDYRYITINSKYKITYLPYSKIAVKVESR